MQLTLTLTCPSTFTKSPSSADKREDFPDPTLPTIATNFFLLICKEILFRTGASSFVHLNVAESIVIGAFIFGFREIEFSSISSALKYLLILLSETKNYQQKLVI